MMTLLIATTNPHKAGEIQAILGDRFRYLTLKDVSAAPEIVEDAPSFAGNAAKKAAGLAQWLSAKARSTRHFAALPGLFVLADDSGLEVDALGGAPGVHSARFAALDDSRSGNSSNAENNAKLLRLLQGVPPERRTARFHCVLALASVPACAGAAPSAASVPVAQSSPLRTEFFDGVCEGRIIAGPRGQRGFGYDPLFVPTGYEQTFAELGEEVKNRLSHRARALEKLKAWLDGATQGRGRPVPALSPG